MLLEAYGNNALLKDVVEMEEDHSSVDDCEKAQAALMLSHRWFENSTVLASKTVKRTHS
jgi:hypothetical protein